MFDSSTNIQEHSCREKGFVLTHCWGGEGSWSTIIKRAEWNPVSHIFIARKHLRWEGERKGRRERMRGREGDRTRERTRLRQDIASKTPAMGESKEIVSKSS